MEIIDDATIQALPEKIMSLNTSPETHTKVTIEEIKENNTATISDKRGDSKFIFLNDDLWDCEKTLIDLSENHDHYLHDEE